MNYTNREKALEDLIYSVEEWPMDKDALGLETPRGCWWSFNATDYTELELVGSGWVDKPIDQREWCTAKYPGKLGILDIWQYLAGLCICVLLLSYYLVEG